MMISKPACFSNPLATQIQFFFFFWLERRKNWFWRQWRVKEGGEVEYGAGLSEENKKFFTTKSLVFFCFSSFLWNWFFFLLQQQQRQFFSALFNSFKQNWRRNNRVWKTGIIKKTKNTSEMEGERREGGDGKVSKWQTRIKRR